MDGTTHISGSPLIVRAIAEAPTTVTDIDGNIYDVVVIGDQIWMAEDLRVTRYADGTSIPHITEASDWITLGDNNTDRAYCFYNNDPDTDYGALYTWAAATNGESNDNNPGTVQGVCPTNWHISTDSEIKELEMFLGMSESQANDIGNRGTDEGNDLKEAGTDHWLNTSGATNSTGFTAIPGGFRRGETGKFEWLGILHVWWSGTESDSYNSYHRTLNGLYSETYRIYHVKSGGESVRCIRD